MAQSFTMDRLKFIFAYPFQDERWKEKLLIASLISFLTFLLIPTIILWIAPAIILAGYRSRIMHGIIIDHREPFLPEWDDWGEMFVRGAKLAVIGFAFSIPVIIFIAVFTAAMISVPILPALMESGGINDGQMSVLFPFLSMVVFIGLLPVSMILGLVGGVIYPAIVGHVVAKDQVSAAFQIREWWQILRSNLSGYLLSYLIIMGASMALNLITQVLNMTIILCCLIPFALAMVTAYQSMFIAALYGVAYRSGADELQSRAVELELPEHA